MSVEDLPVELREWIVARAREGQQPTAVVEALRAQGWEEDAATHAVHEVVQDFLARHARDNGLPVPVPVPEPMELGGPHLIHAGDRKVVVLANLLHPRVVVLGGLLSHAECDELVRQAERRLTRSETFFLDEGESRAHDARTSEGMFFARGESTLCRRIEARLAAACQWPVENGEGLQVLRYRPGAEYKPHYDYFDPARAGSAGILARGGQRVASIVMYLNTPGAGGETIFPDARFSVAPIKGNAVFFSYDRPHPMTGSLHGGAPVLAGEKWVATKWLRERAYH